MELNKDNKSLTEICDQLSEGQENKVNRKSVSWYLSQLKKSK
jgi:3-methyladenine DNA glycosylase AlkD